MMRVLAKQIFKTSLKTIFLSTCEKSSLDYVRHYNLHKHNTIRATHLHNQSKRTNKGLGNVKMFKHYNKQPSEIRECNNKTSFKTKV